MNTPLRAKLIDLVIGNNYPIRDFANYVANCVPIKQVLAVSGFLNPVFVRVGDYIFLRSNLKPEDLQKGVFSTRFGSDKQTVERYFNLFSIDEFFLLASDADSQNPEMLDALAEVLKYSWSLALRDSFPDRHFEFEIARDLFDEDGVCLTFWEK